MSRRLKLIVACISLTVVLTAASFYLWRDSSVVAQALSFVRIVDRDGDVLNIGATGSVPVEGNVVVEGNVASETADTGNPVKIGGVFRAVLPSLTDGQRADIQLDSNGAVLTAIKSGTSSQRAIVDQTAQDGRAPGNPSLWVTSQIHEFNTGGSWDRVRHSFVTSITQTAVGASAAIDMTATPMKTHSWQVRITGAPTEVDVRFQCSNDGTNFFDVATKTTPTDEMIFIANSPCLYTRVNLVTLSGGITPSVISNILSVR